MTDDTRDPGLSEALRSTGAVRHFTDAAVPDTVVYEILDTARFAPSGGNRQPWKVAVIQDRHLRRQLANLMQPIWDEYISARGSGQAPFNPIDYQPPQEITAAPNPLLDQLEHVPVLLAVAADLGEIAAMDADLDRLPIVAGASIYPFCWNILLAARAHGLGGVLTTFLSRAEPAAAEILGLNDRLALAATIMLGYPVERPTRLRRNNVETFTTQDRFDGPTWVND